MSRRSDDWLRSAKALAQTPWRMAAVLLLAALFITNIYRAAAQSISHDEATIFEWLLSGSWDQVLNMEHGNHHVLSDLFSKLMITIFGTSAFALRIPALLGGLLYFYSIFRICAVLFGERILFLLSVAFLSLNPFVLDYLVAARGYGLAVGFFCYTLYQIILYWSESPEARDAKGATQLFHQAGIALGLSVGSNPIMLFPGGALIASFVGMLFVDGLLQRPELVTQAAVRDKLRHIKKERARRTRREAAAERRTNPAQRAILHFVLPAVVVAGFLLLLPKRLIELEPGYMGPPSLFAILEPLVRFSLLHSPTGFPGLAALFSPSGVIRMITYGAVPLLLAVLLAVAARIGVRWTGNRKWNAMPLLDRFLLLLAAMLPTTIVLIVLSRALFAQPYPELRTAMYWIPLLGLALLSLLRRVADGSGIERKVYWPMTALVILCVIQFLTQFNTRYFAEWSYSAAGEDMMRLVRADHAARPGARVKVGATWQLEPIINFYRIAWGLDWMDPVYRESPDNVYDYYLLAFGDKRLVEKRHLTELHSDQLSGTVLAKRTSF